MLHAYVMRYWCLNMNIFFFRIDDVMPLWAKPLVALTFKNLIQNMRDMEAYLQENCTDIDYTAVKMPTGTAQEESGL